MMEKYCPFDGEKKLVHLSMTFALKKDQWHVIRKKARHSYISIKGNANILM